MGKLFSVPVNCSLIWNSFYDSVFYTMPYYLIFPSPILPFLSIPALFALICALYSLPLCPSFFLLLIPKSFLPPERSPIPSTGPFFLSPMSHLHLPYALLSSLSLLLITVFHPGKSIPPGMLEEAFSMRKRYAAIEFQNQILFSAADQVSAEQRNAIAREEIHADKDVMNSLLECTGLRQTQHIFFLLLCAPRSNRSIIK